MKLLRLSTRAALSLHRKRNPEAAFTSVLLRRGSKVSRVLRRFGAVLGDRAGSADAYALSEVVGGLNVFISHNWSTPRRSKFLALALHFNLRMALVMTALVAVGVGPLVVLEILPVIEAADSSSFPLTAPYCTLLFYAVPMATLLFGRDLMAKLSFLPEPYVFLDRVCIHQTDVGIQREGIANLPAFLGISDEMLVVYTSDYPEKLWTSYELASMLMTKDRPRITIASTHLAQILYVCWTCVCVFSLIQGFIGGALEDLGIQQLALWYGVLALCCVPYLWHLRRWALERQSMHAAAGAFRTRSAVCTVEDDRQVVQNNIASFMVEYRFVPRGATTEAALDAFELIAQKRIPAHLEASFGPVGLPYWHSMVMALPLAGRGLDVILANATQNLPANQYAAEVMFYCGQAFLTIPLWVALCSLSTSRYPKLSWAREALFMMALLIFMVAAAAALDRSFVWFYDRALESLTGMVMFVMVLCVLGAVVAYIYRPLPAPRVRLELDYKSQLAHQLMSNVKAVAI